MKKLCSIKDRYYEPSNKKQVYRQTVRGIVLNDKNEVCLLHIVGEDKFGKRNHFELPGGGVEGNETHEETFKREMNEELGFDVSVGPYVCTIEIQYNLLNRWDVGNFYIGHIKAYGEAHLEEYEKALFKEHVFVPLDEIESFYLNHKTTLVGDMIHERDLMAIKEAIKILK